VCLLLLAPLAGAADEAPPRSSNGGQLNMYGVPQIPQELKERIRHYQNVRSASFLDWTPDGKGMYISTRFGEVSQVHQVLEPGGYRQQLTWFPEPAGQVIRREDSHELAITMDRGGGEQDQIFLFDPRNAAIRQANSPSQSSSTSPPSTSKATNRAGFRRLSIGRYGAIRLPSSSTSTADPRPNIGRDSTGSPRCG